MKRILLIIGGGIAAYKSLELIRRLRDAGFEVQAVLTKAGAEFITPLSVAALSEQPVYSELFSLKDETEMGHIQLSRKADVVLVCPATADLMAKMVHGLANDLASTVLLATDKPVIVVPAMNVRMWEHKATQRNLTQLTADGVHCIGPVTGPMACGEHGMGRMSEVGDIVAAVQSHFRAGPLHGKHAIVTAGPTHEPIDPVRYIANRSSGKQGYAVAAALAAHGARVTLVSGPTNLTAPHGTTLVKVETAHEMYEAVHKALPADIAVCVAAVADWRVKPAPQKLKKSAHMPKLELSENPDILASLCALKDERRPACVVGFAAETTDILSHARAKLKSKSCDIIVANDVSETSTIFGCDTTTVDIISATAQTHHARVSKTMAADALVQTLIQTMDLNI